MRKAMVVLVILILSATGTMTWADSGGGGSRCDCDGCCKDSYTNKCYRCGPPPPQQGSVIMTENEPVIANASKDDEGIKWLETIDSECSGSEK